MLDLSQDKRKSIGVLNDANIIKKPYSDLTIGSQNILVSSLNSTVNSNNISQQSNASQQFSLVHQSKPIILGASTSGTAGTFMQSTTGGNTTNKIIVTPSQLSGNIYMSTHGKLVIPSSNSQNIILDNAKMITTNQVTTQPQVQPKLQSSNQQRVKMENKMNMLIESTGEKNIIYAKCNKNSKIFSNMIPVQATGTNKNTQSQNQTTTKQISSIASSQAQQQQQQQQQSISVISSNKSLQRIQTTPFSQQQQTQQVLRPQFGTSKIIQQSNNGSNIIGTVKNNDNSSTSPR
jgi:hypothetical protein